MCGKSDRRKLTAFGFHHRDEDCQETRNSIRRHEGAVCVVRVDRHRSFAHVHETLQGSSRETARLIQRRNFRIATT